MISYFDFKWSKLNSYKIQKKSQIDSSRTNYLSSRPKTLEEVIKILEGSIHKIYESSETIFLPGDPANKLYFIRKGAVRLSRINEDGEEITVDFLKEKTLFGVSSLLDIKGSESFYHAVAFTRVEIDTAPVSSVRSAIEADTNIAMILLQGLSERILHSGTMIETLKSKDTYCRLISFLLVLAKDFGLPSSKGITIDLKISHQAIAEAIGSTRVTITRFFIELRNSGLIANTRQKITIIDPKALTKKIN